MNSHVLAIRICAAGKGMVFKPFTLGLQARTRGGEGGGSLGARARAPVPPPHLGKKFRSEMPKRGERAPPRYVGIK